MSGPFGTGQPAHSWVLTGTGPPPRPSGVSGVALPYGVRLTNGVNSSGAGHLGLLTVGATIYLVFAVAAIGGFVVAWALERVSGYSFLAVRFGTSIGDPLASCVVETMLNLVQALIFLTVFRFTPTSAYHAAEHMTVHAIERGLPLTEDVVRQMPRAHARCGSNLVGPLIAAVVLWPLFAVSWLLWVVVFAVVVHGRSRLGSALQQYFLTRSPADKHLQAGLRSGRQLVYEYQIDPYRRVGRLRQLWVRGYPQMFAGGALAVLVAMAVTAKYHVWLDLGWPWVAHR